MLLTQFDFPPRPARGGSLPGTLAAANRRRHLQSLGDLQPKSADLGPGKHQVKDQRPSPAIPIQ